MSGKKVIHLSTLIHKEIKKKKKQKKETKKFTAAAVLKSDNFILGLDNRTSRKKKAVLIFGGFAGGW